MTTIDAAGTAVWRRLLLAVAALLLGVIAYGAWLFAAALPEPDYLQRKGQLATVELLDSYALEDSTVEELRLTGSSQVSFDIALRIPRDPLPGRPLIVLLAGNETGHRAATQIRDPAGAAVAALSYPFREIPYRDWLPLLRALPDIQRGILDTPSAVLLAIDYLLAREDLAPQRVELVGVSFGAYLAAVPAALDPRVDRLWLIHGSGAPAEVIAHGLEERLPSPGLRNLLGRYLAAIAGAAHLTPERWIGRVAPRPLVVINADADESLPMSAVRQLHERLPADTEVLWTPGKHVHPKRPEIMDLLSAMIRERVIASTTDLSPARGANPLLPAALPAPAS